MSKIIRDETGTIKGESVTLMRYFKPADQSASAFNEELKQLTPESKTELALGAAKELGWTVSDS